MKGYPKFLNTKEDYIYVKDNFSAEQWKPDWQNLLDGLKDWFFDHYLTDSEEGITDDTHKLVTETNEETKETKTAQYILKENPTCKLYRLGFTVKEVEKALAE